MAKIEWKVGDRVYIKLANGRPGTTLYEITSLTAKGPACMIREIAFTKYAEQRWDTSMLFKAGPELLAKRFF